MSVNYKLFLLKNLFKLLLIKFSVQLSYHLSCSLLQLYLKVSDVLGENYTNIIESEINFKTVGFTEYNLKQRRLLLLKHFLLKMNTSVLFQLVLTKESLMKTQRLLINKTNTLRNFY